MKTTIFFIMALIYISEITIFNFTKSSNIELWQQTNDDVMGGISTSAMLLNNNGEGVFSGSVSTKNNGGFAMTRLKTDVSLYNRNKTIVLDLKGDGKKYQFRIKEDRNQQFWYVQSFQTSGKKQKITLPLQDFHPSLRGYPLNQHNFSSTTIEEVAILIANKKDENFKLIINKISIQ